MARGSTRRTRASNPDSGVKIIQRKDNIQTVSLSGIKKREVTTVRDVLNEIESHWQLMPSPVKSFLLGRKPNGLFPLLQFWSNPPLKQYLYLCNGTAESIGTASFFIASRYLKLRMIPETRVLLLHGAFAHQCFLKPIDVIAGIQKRLRDLVTSGEGDQIVRELWDRELPCMSRAFSATDTPENMDAFLKMKLSEKHYKFGLCSKNDKEVMDYVGQISHDWKSSSASSKGKPSSMTAAGSQKLQLTIVDGSGDTLGHVFEIESSATLKNMFNDYAEKRGVSLRVLRFSYQEKTLFLSSVANKTFDEMNIKDQDVIIAYDTSRSQEPSTRSSNSSPIQTKKGANSNKPNGKKNKKNKVIPMKEVDSTKTLEDYKAEHSKVLTKLHEEVEPQLKEIRTRLNALDLQRQPPKQKKKNNRKKKNKYNNAISYCDNQMLPHSDIGGKAGKPYYIVQVGEVENLYKTQKPSHCHQHQSSSTTSSFLIDLHGYTKNEAITTLNEQLPIWVNAAMKLEYPFVTQVKIICGCGNQVLSEVVQEWIKSSRCVRNAPKSL